MPGPRSFTCFVCERPNIAWTHARLCGTCRVWAKQQPNIGYRALNALQFGYVTIRQARSDPMLLASSQRNVGPKSLAWLDSVELPPRYNETEDVLGALAELGVVPT